MIINLGDAPFKAFIKVTYPNGTCTVSNGTKTYTHTGGGTYTFAVNKKGTWTVKGVYNTISRTSTVSITTRGETKSVTLSYDYVIFNYSKTVNYTGGWATSTARYKKVTNQSSGLAPTVTKNSDGSITLSVPSGGKSGIYYAKVKINTSDYSKVYLNASGAGSYDHGKHTFLGLTTSLSEFVQSSAVAEKNLNDATNGNVIDVSGLNGSYYLVFGIYANCSVTVKQIKLVF